MCCRLADFLLLKLGKCIWTYALQIIRLPPNQDAIYSLYMALEEVLPMSIGSVFVNNRTQAVRLPADTRFPDDVKQVNVRIVGKDRILSPVESTWDSFFLSDEHVSDDFMEERASQEQSEREAF